MATEHDQAFLSLFQPGAELRDAALAYASLQLFVFPLAPNTKDKPLLKAWQNHATTSFVQVKRWWPEGSANNIAIYLRPSCVVVIDVDPRNGGDESLDRLIDKFGELPRTYTVRTGGNGRHYYFRVPADFYDNASYPAKIADGVELLVNKYVVAPPSKIDDEHRYAIESGDIQDDFTLLPFKWLEKIFTERETAREDSLLTRWRESEDWIIPKGERNNLLTSFAGILRRYALSTEEIDYMLRGLAGRVEDFHEVESEIRNIAHSIGNRPPSSIGFADVKLNLRDKVNKPTLDPVALYGPIGDYVKFLEPMTEAHPAAILAQSLTCFGNMLGAMNDQAIAPGFTVEDAYHRPALYVVLVGDSARAGKGDSWSRVKKLFMEVDPTWKYYTGIHTGEGLIEALADDTPLDEVSLINGQPVQHMRKGSKTQDKRYFVIESEFGRVLHNSKRQGSIIKDIYRVLWDEGETAKVTAGSQRQVTNATVSLVAHITKAELDREFDETDFYSGFGNRFMFVYTERTKILPLAKSLSVKKLYPFIGPLQEALMFAQEEAPSHYRFSADAWDYWCDFVQQSERRKASGVVDQLFSRARPFVLRLALIYAVTSFSDRFELEHLEAAEAFWNYCADSAIFLFSNRIGDRNADKLYRALLEYTPGLTRTDISTDVFNRDLSKEKINRCLDSLVERGLVVTRQEKRGRKTVDVFFAKPQLYQ